MHHTKRGSFPMSGEMCWSLTTLISLAIGMLSGYFLASPVCKCPEEMPRFTARMNIDKSPIEQASHVLDCNSSSPVTDDSTTDNPYPYYPWWPEFNAMVMESKAMEGITKGDRRHGEKVEKKYISELLYKLDEYAAAHPTKENPYKVTERPEALTYDCQSSPYLEFLTGETRKKPVKVAWAFQFAGEFPLLDIALHEFDGVVDHFIIYESTSTHRFVHKPLYFERHKQRYKRFLDRVVHLVGDDQIAPVSKFSEPTFQGPGQSFDVKHHKLITEKSKLLNDILSSEDIYMMGDLDEMADYKFIYHLKHCEIKDDHFPAFSNTIFYMGDFRNMFAGDHPPMPGWKYSHKQPIIYTMEHLKKEPNARNIYGLKVKHVPPIGGYHLSAPAYIPSLMIKFFGGTGYGMGPPTSNMSEWYEMYRSRDSMKPPKWDERIRGSAEPTVPERYKKAIRLPWFVEHNKEQFPFLFFDMPAVDIT